MPGEVITGRVPDALGSLTLKVEPACQFFPRIPAYTNSREVAQILALVRA